MRKHSIVPIILLCCCWFVSQSVAAEQYKRLHRDQITNIAKGEPEKAIAFCNEYLDKHPNDVESSFVLAAAYAQQGNLEQSMQYVQMALDAGMSLDRFLAGPRELLASLTTSAAFQELSRMHTSPVIHGPMLGDVTDNSIRVWVRTRSEASVRVLVSESAEMAPLVASSAAWTRNEEDRTATVRITGLQPDKRYHYQVFVNGEPTLGVPREFSTAPQREKPASFQIAFGGGAGYTPQYERMWRVISEHRPLSLLLLGDNVYIDTPEVPATQRYCYYRRQSRPEFADLVASTPIYAIYDDHDFGTNDCVPGPSIAEPAWKRQAWEVFRQNWANPDYGSSSSVPGCWFSFSIGDVDFFMLDSRYYRDLKAEPPTMLGSVQKAWLLKLLSESKATFKMLISAVPWTPGTKPGSKDTWDGFPEEREEIFTFLEQERINGVLLLCADRHRSDVWQIQRPNGYDLYEFESSRLTNIHTHKAIPGALFSYNEKCSFGLLKFDTTEADPEVTYEIHNIEGEKIHSFQVRLSQLVHPVPNP